MLIDGHDRITVADIPDISKPGNRDFPIPVDIQFFQIPDEPVGNIVGNRDDGSQMRELPQSLADQSCTVKCGITAGDPEQSFRRTAGSGFAQCLHDRIDTILI